MRSRYLQILVIDDDARYVRRLVQAFERKGMRGVGCDNPVEVLGWRSREKFDYDLIMLDMRLGEKPDGAPLNALEVLPHLKTYAPSAKVLIVTIADLGVGEILRCIELGAEGVFPKGAEFDELCVLAEVHQRLGDPRETRQELIEVLWESVNSPDGDPNGQRLEMLVMNLFESMPTFRVVDNNVSTRAGTMDVLVENKNQHQFWEELGSLYLAIECKNHRRPPEPQHFNQLKEVVRSRLSCNVGILFSMSSFTESFRQRQGEAEGDGVHIFGIAADDLGRLIETRFDEREEYLRGVLERQ
jgi:ActR/RegA family two-component response regulator